MHFNNHYELKEDHAFLSPSKSSWVNYTPEKLRNAFLKAKAKERGAKLHKLAAEMILNGVKGMKSKKTFYSYVNDVIGFRMTPEQKLVHSRYAYGTADAISFDEKKRFLRIFDLKTGETPAHMTQLMIYAALFCLEYNYDPFTIDVELRIYQFDDISICNPEPEDIKELMIKIRENSEILEKLERETE